MLPDRSKTRQKSPHREGVVTDIKKRSSTEAKGSAGGSHAKGTAAGTDADIVVPYLAEHFADRKTGKALSKALMSLQLENDAEHLPLGTISEEAVIADLLKTFGKDMQQETANEFYVRESHFRGFVCTVVPVREGGVGLRDRTDPGIGDSDTIRIAAKIFDGVAHAVEGLFDEGAPVLFVETVDQGLP